MRPTPLDLRQHHQLGAHHLLKNLENDALTKATGSSDSLLVSAMKNTFTDQATGAARRNPWSRDCLSPADAYYGQIRAVGGETSGPAVTQDMQCRTCEQRQDTPQSGSPHSLVQRGQAPPGPNKASYVGKQFEHTSSDQMVELTKVKIEEVVKDIRKLLGLAPTKSRPATHPIYVQVVDPGQTDALLSKLSADALAKATATVPAGSYPT